MRQLQWYYGRVHLELTAADIACILNKCSEEFIILFDIHYCSELSVQCSILKKDYQKLLNIAQKTGTSIKLLNKSGLFWKATHLVKRPVLLIFFGAVLIMFSFLPSRILFVQVEGNIKVPTNKIVDVAYACGIGFGVPRREIRSEVIKNALLEKIPELQWAGVNTYGCVAVLSVREKETLVDQDQQTYPVNSIVASRDGIIQTCTVLNGNPLCYIGQAVKAGQTLVSGYVDCGITTLATNAKAEIQALTFRELRISAPAASIVRGSILDKDVRYRLQFGKNLINLFKDSGILHASCAKMYTKHFLTLPGGYVLPIAFIKETVLFYENQEPELGPSEKQWVETYAKNYLKESMIAGEIISSDSEIRSVGNTVYFSGDYACLEMIGKVKIEDKIVKGENNG